MPPKLTRKPWNADCHSCTIQLARGRTLKSSCEETRVEGSVDVQRIVEEDGKQAGGGPRL